MNFKISYKHMPTSQSLTNFTCDIVENRITKYTKNPISISLVFEQKNKKNLVTGKLINEKGCVTIVHEKHKNIYKCVDLFSHKLERSLRKQKNILSLHKNHKSIKHIPENIED